MSPPSPTTTGSLRAEYRTIREAAGLLRVTPKRVRNMMAAGLFVAGYHYFRRRGLAPRFRLDRLVEWLEAPGDASEDMIPMASQKRRIERLRRGSLQDSQPSRACGNSR